ncbi:MAG: hypothetical protein PHD76_15070, partial [Methylacidiphilales bacterium]|nr:hypothetical protein [Candidatus Methylacidiphilales bacterium]
ATPPGALAAATFLPLFLEGIQFRENGPAHFGRAHFAAAFGVNVGGAGAFANDALDGVADGLEGLFGLKQIQRDMLSVVREIEVSCQDSAFAPDIHDLRQEAF